MSEKNAAPKVDGEFLNPFIGAAKTTLETQANIQITPSKAFIKKNTDDYPTSIEIAGIINLTCQQFSGSIALCFNSETFFKIYESMLDETPQELNEEVSDCAGELLNIIFGTAKTALQTKGYKLERAIPTVLIGEKLKVQFRSKYPAIVLPFESSAGNFFIEILVDPD
ncbi:MAG: chemotaxis protein CheX [Bdellovibrionales bacterium]|nr:chemotaxis protein CheX [Bdellovibrionales bacterium]